MIDRFVIAILMVTALSVLGVLTFVLVEGPVERAQEQKIGNSTQNWLLNPANPASPISPMNPSNPLSPLRTNRFKSGVRSF